jgi:hypothetical protein
MRARKALKILVPIGGLVFASPIWAQTNEVTAATVVAQTNEVSAPVYQREVFGYSGRSRPDPFRSLLQDGDLGVRVEDLTLRVVIYNDSDPTQSVAVLAQRGSERRLQARVGERSGSLRILAILPEQIDIVIEELGVSRRETLTIAKPRPAGTR